MPSGGKRRRGTLPAITDPCIIEEIRQTQQQIYELRKKLNSYGVSKDILLQVKKRIGAYK